jgi:hypothetical protein
MAHMLTKLKERNINIMKLFNQNTYEEFSILKTFLIPFLEMFIKIHPKGKEYNTFAYDYLLNGEWETKILYIVENFNDNNINVKKINSNDFEKYLKDNELSFEISGALFFKHEKHLGLINKFLNERLSMRAEYKKLRDSYDEGSPEYIDFDKKQNTMKTNANSSYGLSGMKNFRFSNRYLAASTTLSGKLTLKIAQMCGEIYLRNMKKLLFEKE